MLTTTVLASILSAPLGAPDFAERLDHAELTGSDSEAQIIAYDVAGEVIGTIALWVEPEGQIYLASDYSDGYAETIVADGRARTDSTLPHEVIAARADAMLGVLGLEPLENRFACAVGVIATGLSCAAPSPACPFSLYGAACACLPLAMKDFKCPVF
jgi:hypothetical protein